jgi:Putative Actinobacterial Holin-X, holin superfamily III
MSTPVQIPDGPVQAPGGEPTVTALVTGILNDVQDLLCQQLALFKSEFRADIVKAREAALSITLGMVILALGSVALCFMSAHFLSWAFEMPVWIGFGIVGAVLVVVGLALYFLGRRKLVALNPIPEQTLQSFKENVQWLKTPM